MRMRHILLPSDLSEESLRPFEDIAAFAAHNNSRITLLHVVSDLKVIASGAPLAPPMSSPHLSHDLAAAHASLEDQRASLPSGLQVEVAVHPAEGSAQGIADWAEKNEVDMIAISTHGRTGFRHLALGSVAESLLHLSSVPVLCFPRKS
ncbi:MAG: nucleotide-binding universal stress UspA family protein [Planctomycetota bacterium]|jgi:nucleotide-binding universal stress UspA family protein